MILYFEPIATARRVHLGQVAMLRLPCGCEVRAVFEARTYDDIGEVYAWWPYRADGPAIGLLAPLAWLPLFNELMEHVQ